MMKKTNKKKYKSLLNLFLWQKRSDLIKLIKLSTAPVKAPIVKSKIDSNKQLNDCRFNDILLDLTQALKKSIINVKTLKIIIPPIITLPQNINSKH